MSSSDDEPDLSTGSDASTGFNALELLSRRWPLLVLGLIIGTIIGVVIHLRASPQYQSSCASVGGQETDRTRQGR